MNPFGWLTSTARFPDKWVGGSLGLMLAVWVLFFLGTWIFTTGRSDENFIISFSFAFGLHLVVKGLVALQATRRLCEDRQSGALELLLATALTPEEIIAGQWQTLCRQFRPFLWALTLMNVALTLMALVFRPSNMGVDVALTFSSFFLGGIVLLWMDFYALGWFGMWMALRGARSHRVVLFTLARILGPPWLVVFLFLALVAFGRGLTRESLWVCWTVWLTLSIMNSYASVVRRKKMLLQDFRRLAVGDEPAKAIGPLQPWSPEWEVPPARSQASPPPVSIDSFPR